MPSDLYRKPAHSRHCQSERLTQSP